MHWLFTILELKVLKLFQKSFWNFAPSYFSVSLKHAVKLLVPSVSPWKGKEQRADSRSPAEQGPRSRGDGLFGDVVFLCPCRCWN